MEKKLIDVVRRLKNFDNEQQAYLDSVPEDIRSAIFSNTYSECQAKQKDILMETLFGNMCEDVEWFLYEYQEGINLGQPHVITSDGVEHHFNTNEDYYAYLEVYG